MLSNSASTSAPRAQACTHGIPFSFGISLLIFLLCSSSTRANSDRAEPRQPSNIEALQDASGSTYASIYAQQYHSLYQHLVPPKPADSQQYHLCPERGSLTGDGSLENPYPALSEILSNGLIQHQAYSVATDNSEPKLIPICNSAPIQAGDTLILHDGNHGSIRITNFHLDQPLFIESAPNSAAILERVELICTSNLLFNGVHITAGGGSHPTEIGNLPLFREKNHHLIGNSHHNYLINSTLYTTPDTSEWTLREWEQLSALGIFTEASHSIYLNNHIFNVAGGAFITGSHNKFLANSLQHLSGRAFLINGNHTEIRHNWIEHHVRVSTRDHSDNGITSYTSFNTESPENTGSINNVNVIANVFIPRPQTDQNPTFCYTAIGCFDGMFHNWNVSHNLIIASGWHGITLMGAVDSHVNNNIVIDIDTEDSWGPYWIEVSSHKNGTPSANTSIRNNLATFIRYRPEHLQPEHNRSLEFPEISRALLIDQLITYHNNRLREHSQSLPTGDLADQQPASPPTRHIPPPNPTQPEARAPATTPSYQPSTTLIESLPSTASASRLPSHHERRPNPRSSS